MISSQIQMQFLLLLLLKRRNNYVQPCVQQKRRWWVRPINQDREKKGEFRRLALEIKIHDVEWFFAYTRMTPALFDNLLSLVGPTLTKHSIRKPLSASQRLVITLRFLATGDSYFSIANSYLIGKSTVCVVIQETLLALWKILSPIVLPEPTEQQLKIISDDFCKTWNMPHCVGSIDGKHVRIAAPSKSGSLYYNYKGYFSIILMGVSDANYNFTYIDIGSYGSVSDGGVFGTSLFGKHLISKQIPMPKPTNLPGSNVKMAYFFVGDSAFPLSESLMRPYSGRMLNIVKSVFNYRLARARRIIENAFGILVARWRIYQRTICASPSTADNIIKATVCLHNFIRRSLPAQKRYSPKNYVDNGDMLGMWRDEVRNATIETCRRLGSNNSTFGANQMRNNLAKYFLSPAGFKAGQLEYVKRT